MSTARVFGVAGKDSSETTANGTAVFATQRAGMNSFQVGDRKDSLLVVLNTIENVSLFLTPKDPCRSLETTLQSTLRASA